MIEHYQNDKSTVFSIVPFGFLSSFPGLYPGFFRTDPCYDDSQPVRLLVGASEHLIEIGDQPRPMRVVTPSFQIAKGIVDDFFDGQIWITPEARPGLSWIQGDVSVLEFKTKHLDVYKQMKTTQKNWFVHICNKTSDEWNKYKNSRVVSDQARFAAKVLGLEPEWLNIETVGLTFTKCPACGTPNAAQNAVCSNCRCVLDKEKFKTLQFAS